MTPLPREVVHPTGFDREVWIECGDERGLSHPTVTNKCDGATGETALQLVGICFLLVHYPYRMPLVGETLDFSVVGFVLLTFSVLMSYYSAVEYTVLFGFGLAKQRVEG